MHNDPQPSSDIVPLTALIERAAQDADGNSKEALYERVYADLRAAAHRCMRHQRRHDLQTTALVHEVVVRIEKADSLRFMKNRRVFFSVAARAMNQVLIDHHRRRKKLVDSPDRTAEPLDGVVRWVEDQAGHDFERLQIALTALAAESPRQHEVVMHRFFGGLSLKETAELLGVSVPTIERDWRLARAKLLHRLSEG